MANVLIFPFPEFGHISPTLRMARQLASEGHTVTYITAPQFGRAINNVGAVIEPLIAEGPSGSQFSGAHIWYEFLHQSGEESRGSGIEKLLSRILGQRNFDLLLCDGIIARSLRDSISTLLTENRVILYSTSLFNWQRFEPIDMNAPILLFCPDSFEVPKFRLRSKRLFYVEPSLRPLDFDDHSQIQLPDTSPIVLVTFGTQSVRYRDLNERFTLIGLLAERFPRLHFVLSTGISSIPNLTRFRPGLHNLSVQNHIPQRLLLSKASAIITHGGLGTVKEAIAAAVPMIVLPITHDQPYNGMRVRYHNLGEAIFPERLSLSLLDRALRRALDGAHASGLASMQATFLAMESSRISHLLLQNRLSSVGSVST